MKMSLSLRGGVSVVRGVGVRGMGIKKALSGWESAFFII